LTCAGNIELKCEDSEKEEALKSRFKTVKFGKISFER